MSRIFDALLRSKEDGDGFEFPLTSSLATEVPLPTDGEIRRDVEIRRDAEVRRDVEIPTDIRIEDLTRNDTSQFQSLEISASSDSRLVSLTDEASLGAEKFRFLGVRLRQLRRTRLLKKLLITSTIPGEGKTMVSANLALSLAQRRPQKVVLVEGDLRRPALSTRFGLPSVPGLTEWLEGSQGPAQSIYHLGNAGLYFLPAGSPPANPLELMQSERLTEIMDQLTERFDWVVIDSPPVVPLADTSIWMRSADGILMVVREDVTQKRQLQNALQELEQSKFLGVVLNHSSNSDHKDYYNRYGPAPAPSNGDPKTNTRIAA